jgi:hypothetical protein
MLVVVGLELALGLLRKVGPEQTVAAVPTLHRGRHLASYYGIDAANLVANFPGNFYQ